MRGPAARAGDRPPAGPVQRAGQLVPDGLLGDPGGGEDGVEVEAGAHAGLLQHVDQLLGGDVAAGARGERAAAEAADRGVELGHPGLDRGQRVGLAGAAGVVEVHADRDARGRPGGRRPAAGRPAAAWSSRWCRPRHSWSAPAVTAARATSTVRVIGVRPSNGQSQAVAMMTSSEPPAPWASRGDLADGAHRLGRRPAGVGPAVPVGRRDDVLEVRDAGVDGAHGAPRVGDQGRPVHARPSGTARRRPGRRRRARAPPSARRRTSPRSAGRRWRPAPRASPAWPSSGTGASSCRPSRMPTSRTSTAVGQHQVELVHGVPPRPALSPVRILHPSPGPPMGRPGTVPERAAGASGYASRKMNLQDARPFCRWRTAEEVER